MMRPDQIQRLRALQEKLADVVLDEADPDQWPGTGALADITREERGDRYWCKKNAAATFALLERCTSMLAFGGTGATNPTEEDVDEQIRKREREADKLLKDAIGRAKAGDVRAK